MLNPRLKQLLSGKTLSVLERKGKLFVCTAHNKRFRALPIGHRKAKLVVEELLWLKMYGKRKHLFYLTKCDCGNKRILSVHSIIDAATSCGCIQREHDFLRTHGYTRTSRGLDQKVKHSKGKIIMTDIIHATVFGQAVRIKQGTEEATILTSI